MALKVRRTRLLARDEHITHKRSAALVVVATEDTYAGAQYLEGLQEAGLVDRSRLKIVTLRTEDGRSALGGLLERLRGYKEKLDTHLEEDAYWAVFDVDNREAKELADGARTAKASGQRLAGSNPCLELWLLLHVSDETGAVAPASEDRHAARRCCAMLHERLHGGQANVPGYDKRRIRAERFATSEGVRAACARARQLMSAKDEPWPSGVGTHMHLLVESVLVAEGTQAPAAP